jgi:hypothetical protein
MAFSSNGLRVVQKPKKSMPSIDRPCSRTRAEGALLLHKMLLRTELLITVELQPRLLPLSLRHA